MLKTNLIRVGWGGSQDLREFNLITKKIKKFSSQKKIKFTFTFTFKLFAFMKKYSNSSYRLEIKRCEMEDAGEYIVKAVNSYGEREYNPYLNVVPLPKQQPPVRREFTYERRVFQEVKLDLWQEPDARATFTFKLRPRLIQSGT